MDVEEFEIEKTWDAIISLGPRSTIAQLSALTLLITAGLWTFGTPSENNVEVPIIGIELGNKIATALGTV